MATLLDIIRQNMNSATAPQGATDEGQKARTLLRARSGKAVGTPQGAVSSVGEQVATAGTNAQLGQLAGASAGAQQQLQNAATNVGVQEKLQRGSLDLQNLEQNQRTAQQQQSILGQSGRQAEELALDKAKSAADQRAFERGFQTKQFEENLSLARAQARLHSASDFKREVTKRALGNDQQVLSRILGYDTALGVQRRDHTAELAKMDLSAALQMANNALADAKTAGQWSAVGGVTSGAISAYGSQQEGKFDKQYQNDVAGGYKGSYDTWNTAQSNYTPAGPQKVGG